MIAQSPMTIRFHARTSPPPRQIAACLLFAAFALLLCCQPQSAMACRYNVRDVGFVSLGDRPYTLILGHSPDARASELDAIRAAAKPMLGDTNVVWRNLKLTELTEFDPPIESGSTTTPGLWLSTPSGVTRLLTQFDEGLPRANQLAALITSLTDSPSHQRLLEQTIRCHSVVLLVECDSESENASAASAAKDAIRVTVDQRDSWDKPISEAPRLMTISSNDKLVNLCERIGLQSSCEHPQIVIFYGRGVVLGSVLTGDAITANTIRQRLDVLGRDCECEMDRSLLTGVSIPHRWTSSHERASAKELGFDPGSPLVVSEVRSIVLRKSLTSEQKILLDARPLAGYQEFDLSGLESDDSQTDQTIRTEESEVNAPSDPEAPIEDILFSDTQASTSSISFSTIFLAMLTLIVALSIAVGGSIFLRARLRR